MKTSLQGEPPPLSFVYYFIWKLIGTFWAASSCFYWTCKAALRLATWLMKPIISKRDEQCSGMQSFLLLFTQCANHLIQIQSSLENNLLVFFSQWKEICSPHPECVKVRHFYFINGSENKCKGTREEAESVGGAADACKVLSSNRLGCQSLLSRRRYVSTWVFIVQRAKFWEHKIICMISQVGKLHTCVMHTCAFSRRMRPSDE